MSIKKEDTISKVLKKYPETAKVFQSFGMHCLGCPTATNESIDQAAGVHGIDLDQLMEALNKVAQE
ncbi:DUF1858 domain-containing protein [Halonatronum saccharophilum]|uniref:DUF1858 domain-containing protein n=1 Tax=Halonatronum saccharophilum TaxID=150060 RepID=UPI000486F039|nr:DUF1858 domain-containing protein [Halonatronum saccharophilum]